MNVCFGDESAEPRSQPRDWQHEDTPSGIRVCSRVPEMTLDSSRRAGTLLWVGAPGGGALGQLLGSRKRSRVCRGAPGSPFIL